MKHLTIVLLSAFLVLNPVRIQGLENLLGTDIQKCLNCLCHARTGCWRRTNCAKYSISTTYWRLAGSHSITSDQNEDRAYSTCMKDENCILNTIKSYTDRIGKDCNCDGEFDCKDRFAIHLFGEECMNPKFGKVYAERFNHCSQDVGVSYMSVIEGDCTPEVF